MPQQGKPASPSKEADLAPRGKVKGTLLLARLKYLRSRGPDAEERILRRMSTEDRTTLKGMILPSSWYPEDLLLRLELTIAAILAGGDRAALFTDMGRFSAENNLGPNGIQRPYLRSGDPHFLLRNVPRMYTAQHSTGHRTYEQTGDRSVVIRSFETEKTVAEDCLTAVGWLARAIELSGGREARVEETRCRARGDPHCEFRCEWV